MIPGDLQFCFYCIHQWLVSQLPYHLVKTRVWRDTCSADTLTDSVTCVNFSCRGEPGQSEDVKSFMLSCNFLNVWPCLNSGSDNVTWSSVSPSAVLFQMNERVQTGFSSTLRSTLTWTVQPQAPTTRPGFLLQVLPLKNALESWK